MTPNAMPTRVAKPRVIVDTVPDCWDERCDCRERVTRLRLRQPRRPRPIRNTAMADALRAAGIGGAK